MDNNSFLLEKEYDFIFEAYLKSQLIVMDKCQQKYRKLEEFECQLDNCPTT